MSAFLGVLRGVHSSASRTDVQIFVDFFNRTGYYASPANEIEGKEVDKLIDISNDVYHAQPAISASWLKMLNKSPMHMWHAYINPEREKQERTPAMMLGSLTHTLVLEPQKFDSEYAVVPEGIDKRSKDGKALFAWIEGQGKTPVKAADLYECQMFAAALHANDVFQQIRKNEHVNESTYYWDDVETGLACKFRADTIVFPCDEYPNGALTDVKTAASADPAVFGRQFFDLGYHIQAAHYAEGFMDAFGTDEPPEFIFEVVEKSAPYIVQLYRVQESVMEYGFAERARLMTIAAECYEKKNWPGYTSDPVSEILVPAWIDRQMSNEGEVSIEYV